MPIILPERFYETDRDEAHEITENAIEEVSEELELVYWLLYVQLLEDVSEILNRLYPEYDKKRRLYASGKISKDDYKRWRKSKLLRGDMFSEISDLTAKSLLDANRESYEIVNGYMPSVYAENFNWTAYKIEKTIKARISFDIYDENTVERLLKDNPELLPKASVNSVKDVKWNKQNVTAAIMQSIISGESLDDCARRVANVTETNQKSAIKNTKTMMTSAQNGGRQACYEKAEKIGIEGDKTWVATLDGHTREEHRNLDGESVGIHERFSNGLLFPGDPDGAPASVYNCRCRMIETFRSQDFSKFKRDDRLEDIDYETWKHSKGAELLFKKARNVNRDYSMMREYRKLLGKSIPSHIKDFQTLKYENPEVWKELVRKARIKRNERRHPHG